MCKTVVYSKLYTLCIAVGSHSHSTVCELECSCYVYFVLLQTAVGFVSAVVCTAITLAYFGQIDDDDNDDDDDDDDDTVADTTAHSYYLSTVNQQY